MYYRVILRVKYADAYFNFKSAQEACEFAETALLHSTGTDEQEEYTKVELEVIREKEDK